MCIHLCLHPLTIAFVRRIDSAVGSIVLLHVPVVYYWILRLTVVGDLGFPTPNFKIPISKRSEHDTAPYTTLYLLHYMYYYYMYYYPGTIAGAIYL